MTRTERASFPRALEKDRHNSRTGLNTDPHHVPKNGEGKHSWGSDMREFDHEVEAFEDEDLRAPVDEVLSRDSDETASKPIPVRKSSEGVTEEEREKARSIRANALKSGSLSLA